MSGLRSVQPAVQGGKFFLVRSDRFLPEKVIDFFLPWPKSGQYSKNHAILRKPLFLLPFTQSGTAFAIDAGVRRSAFDYNIN